MAKLSPKLWTRFLMAPLELVNSPKFAVPTKSSYDAVPAELVQDDPPVAGNTDRVGSVAGVGERELDVVDAVAITGALRVDAIAGGAVDRIRVMPR